MLRSHSQAFDAVLHDPPSFGIAGELYSQTFYDQLARVLKRKGMLFHYTGTPNKLTSGRDVPNEVATRLRRAGFETELRLDGVFASEGRRSFSLNKHALALLYGGVDERPFGVGVALRLERELVR